MDTDRETTEVIILTNNYRVNGRISLAPDARLTDYILTAEPFIVVTDADVKDRNGEMILTASFMNVHRDKIEIIIPVELADKK